MECKSYIESIACSAARKAASLYRARQHFSPESILHIYKSTIRPCLEYCCHIWGGAPSCFTWSSQTRSREESAISLGPTYLPNYSHLLTAAKSPLCASFISTFMACAQMNSSLWSLACINSSEILVWQHDLINLQSSFCQM